MIRKAIVLSVLLTMSILSNAQKWKVKPLFRAALYDRLTIIKDIKKDDTKITKVRNKVNTTFDHDITIGLKVYYKGFFIEGLHTTSSATNNFWDNNPYSTEYYLGVGWEYKKLRIKIEHMCKHPVLVPYIGESFKVRGGHDMIMIEYGF